MKKLFFTFAIGLFAQFAIAQHQFGLRTGYQSTNITIDGVSSIIPDAKQMDNFFISAFYYFPIQGGFGFQPELSLSQKGFVFKENFDVDIFDFDVPLGAEARTRIKYIEAPLLLKYTNSDKLVEYYFELGPVIGYAVDADVKTRINAIVDINLADTDINLSNNIYNRWEASAMLGMGLGIPIGNTTLQLGVRYQHSISDLLNDPIIDVRGRNYGVSGSIGLAYNL